MRECAIIRYSSRIPHHLRELLSFMKKNIFEILDDSNDKAYFTMVPNYILNHSTGDEQALYMQMKKFAGEKGKCFTSQETLAKRLSWGEFKVRANIKKLLNRKWIVKAGTVRGKTRPVNAYKIVDLWKMNVDYYHKKIKVDSTVSSKKKKDTGSQHVKIPADSTVEEDLIKKKKNNKSKKNNSLTLYEKKLQGLKDKESNKEPYRLAKLLYDLIKSKNTAWKEKPNWDKWANEIRLLNEADQRSWQQIEFMINWCQNDSFWQTVILSPSNLRRKFNRLCVQAKGKQKKVGFVS